MAQEQNQTEQTPVIELRHIDKHYLFPYTNRTRGNGKIRWICSYGTMWIYSHEQAEPLTSKSTYRATMYVGWPKGWAVFRLAKEVWKDEKES